MAFRDNGITALATVLKKEQNIKIIENDVRYTIFDFLKVLENAEEIHMMQSCFKELINSYVLEKPNIYIIKFAFDILKIPNIMDLISRHPRDSLNKGRIKFKF
jgi:hypothetical protein